MHNLFRHLAALLAAACLFCAPSHAATLRCSLSTRNLRIPPEPGVLSMPTCFRLSAGFLFLALSFSAQAATVVPLNDTGQALCYDSAGNPVSCATSKDDGNYGRDAANTATVLTKTGAGSAGFDFTKIANNGTTLAAGAVLGAAATDWACTKDNVTGLTWEVKTTDSGLRDWGNTYTWYSTDGASNGLNVGDNTDTTTCGGTPASCNTEAFVAAVNVDALCGYTDWRMPSLRELKSLVDFSVAAPTINATYFPNTKVNWFWTANNNSSDSALAWIVFFNNGISLTGGKSSFSYVRLVRGGQ